MPKYVIITPVRDEELYISETIRSVLGQSHLPERWVIVDDGSTDKTLQIIEKWTREIGWITVLTTGSEKRNLGSAEIIAFKRGLEVIGDISFDFIVKLDGDVSFGSDYFQNILNLMLSDTGWGITSGTYCEKKGDAWVKIEMPFYHAAGASKILRRECYEAIGGFVSKKGWDTLDEIRAGLKGWKTGHFEDIKFLHLKPEGAAMGNIKTHKFHGEIYYETGGGIIFLLAKAFHRMFSMKPYIIGGAAMIIGYLSPLARRKPRLVDREEAHYYRKMLNKRLLQPLTCLFSARQ
jgi:poly-beta-1,6-N-acetyl-D-glucosamine synthase